MIIRRSILIFVTLIVFLVGCSDGPGKNAPIIQDTLDSNQSKATTEIQSPSDSVQREPTSEIQSPLNSNHNELKPA